MNTFFAQNLKTSCLLLILCFSHQSLAIPGHEDEYPPRNTRPSIKIIEGYMDQFPVFEPSRIHDYSDIMRQCIRAALDNHDMKTALELLRPSNTLKDIQNSKK